MSKAATDKLSGKPKSGKDQPRLVFSPMLKFRLLAILFDEIQLWKKALTSPALYTLLLGSTLLLSLSWQSGFNYKIDPANALHLDEPFLQNFNSREETTGPDKFTYRWTRGESYLDFKALGKRGYGLRLTMQPSENRTPNLGLTVLANETLVGNYAVVPGPHDYDFEIPATALEGANGDLKITIKTTAFQAPGDARQLGLVFMSAEIQARNSGFAVPPVKTLAYLLAAVALVYLVLARSGFKGSTAGWLGLVLAAILAYGIAVPARPWLTIFADKIVFAAGLALILLVILDLPMRSIWGNRQERSWVLSIFGLALAFRLAGVLHPQAFLVDIGFHNNLMILFWDRGEYFHKIVSGEWGGRPTYYPMQMYAVVGLFRWLVPDTLLLLKLWMVIFDTSRVLLMFYLVKKAVGDSRAAILAAFLMATTPVALISIGFGQVSNLYGEWLLMVGLCLLVVKLDKLKNWPTFTILTLVFLASFLQHPGIIILSGSVFLLVIILFALRRDKGTKAAFLAYFLALALSIVLYHYQTIGDMLPQAFSTIGNKVGTTSATESKCVLVGGSVGDGSLGLNPRCAKDFGDWLTGGLAGFWAEARAYFNLLPVLMVPFSLWWLWNTSRPNKIKIEIKDNATLRTGRNRLFRAGIAWFVVGIFFAIVGWTINLYVRYSLFLLPFVTLSGAIFLSRLWKRTGWPGKALALTVCAFFLVSIVALWYFRIIYRSSELRP